MYTKRIRKFARKVDGKFATEVEDHVIDDDPKHIEYVPLCGNCYLKEVLKK